MTRSYAPPSLYVAPTLVIGLGGTGVSIIRLIRSRIRQSVHQMPGIIEFLAVDTEPVQNLPGQERIFDREITYLGDYNAAAVLNNLDKHPHIADWWFRQDTITGSIHKGARQRRAVGRISLYTRWGQFVQRLDPKLLKIRQIAEKERIERQGIDVERTGQVRVYIIASLCGGTGSGTFLDVAFRVRKALGDAAEIIGIFLMPSCFLPEMQSRIQQQRIQGNAYAALRELNHFLSGGVFDSCFPDHSYRDGAGNKIVVPLKRPFDMVFLVDRSNGREFLSSIDSIHRMSAQYVFLDIITPLGKRLAGMRENLNDLASEQRKTGVLAIAGFVTASLVLPADATTSISSMFGAQFLNNHILGLTLTTAKERALQSDLDESFRAWERELRFEKIEVASDDDFDPLALMFGDEGGASSNIDLSNARAVEVAIMRQMRTKLENTFVQSGLYGSYFVVDRLINRVDQLRKQYDTSRERKRAELQQLQAAAPTAPRAGPLQWLRQRINRGDDTANSHDDKTQQQESINRLTVEEARDSIVLRLLDRMSEQLKEVRRAIEAMRQTCQAWQGELLKAIEQRTTGMPQGRNGQSDVDVSLFELATTLGNEQPVLPMGQRQPSEPPLLRYLASRFPQGTLRKEHEGELQQQLMQMGIFSLKVEDTPDGPLLMLHNAPEHQRNNLFDRVCVMFDEHVRAHTSSVNQISIVDYLNWFYHNVPYTTKTSTTSRNSPIDPLRMLRQRYFAPFMEVDESQLGTEHAFDTEPVLILGLSPARSGLLDPGEEDVLDELDNYIEVDTGIPDRIDILYGRYGYKVDDLRQLDEFFLAYRYFMDNLREQLHIHRDWPGHMADLIALRHEQRINQPMSPPSANGQAEPAGLSDSHPDPAPSTNGRTAPPAPSAHHIGVEATETQQPLPTLTSDNASPVASVPAATTTEPSIAQAQAPSAESLSLIQQFDVLTDVGIKRQHNEDSMLARIINPSIHTTGPVWGLYIVADGMGGHSGGEIASRIVIETIQQVIVEHHRQVIGHSPGATSVAELHDLLRSAANAANDQIAKERQRLKNDMGSTLTMALVEDNLAVIANVGDSRTYLYRAGVLRCITQDHSQVMEMVRQGQITLDEIYTHPDRNVILRALDGDPRLQVDLFTERLQPDDRLLLMSDGQWEMTHDETMSGILAKYREPQRACAALINAANAAGGEDNISTIVVRLVAR